ncbi:hypothetical protein EDD22DRAFT_845040 [Suillus occidentalis]|nr:hypothetical protein EDD22DRAFT_845040 [Suillus occidentalis]
MTPSHPSRLQVKNEYVGPCLVGVSCEPTLPSLPALTKGTGILRRRLGRSTCGAYTQDGPVYKELWYYHLQRLESSEDPNQLPKALNQDPGHGCQAGSAGIAHPAAADRVESIIGSQGNGKLQWYSGGIDAEGKMVAVNDTWRVFRCYSEGKIQENILASCAQSIGNAIWVGGIGDFAYAQTIDSYTSQDARTASLSNLSTSNMYGWLLPGPHTHVETSNNYDSHCLDLQALEPVPRRLPSYDWAYKVHRPYSTLNGAQKFISESAGNFAYFASEFQANYQMGESYIPRCRLNVLFWK